MDADDLYGLALDRFVPERGALAKALRKDGRRDQASHVAGLRKPSVAAWAVNQLVRTQHAAMQELLAAGDLLRDAQADLLAGAGDGRALRTASDRERRAVDGLVATARGLLSSEGAELSPAIIERVADTLHAAALDEDARELVRHGRLERELRHVGLGLGLGAGDPFAAEPRARTSAADSVKSGREPESPTAGKADKKAGRSKPPSAADKRAERERAAAAREEAERLRRERSAARRDARAAHTTAQRRSDAARRALEAAAGRRDEAAQALHDAEAQLAAAVAAAEDAADALKRAEADLADAGGSG